MSNTTDLSVIIETLNYERGDEEVLKAILASLHQQTVAAETLEIIVMVDTQKNPQLATFLAELKFSPRIVEAAGLHYYAQKNKGAREASSKLIAFLDSDCQPCATWANTMILGLSEGEANVAAIQGTVTTGKSIQAQAFAIASFAQVQALEPRETAMLTGNNCAFRRDQFLAEPFDEAPWFHGPEVKKIAALRDRGLQVSLDPGAEVSHAFYPGINNFLTFSCYWSWCFLHLRRGNPTGVAWASFFSRLGWLAPLVLPPAKMIMDTRRTMQQRRNMGMSWGRAVTCCLFLYTMTPAIAYGCILERSGRQPPTPLY